MSREAPSDFQARVRQQVRQDALDAAYGMLAEGGWAAITMTGIAAAVGVSRQTLYKEFSSKAQVGEALVFREVERFIDGVADHLSAYDDVFEAIEALFRFAFQQAADNPLLHTVLSGGSGGDSLLPLVTIESQPLFALAGGLLVEHITHRAPELDTEDVEATADVLARLAVSYLLQPPADADTAVRRLTLVALRNLRPQ